MRRVDESEPPRRRAIGDGLPKVFDRVQEDEGALEQRGLQLDGTAAAPGACAVFPTRCKTYDWPLDPFLRDALGRIHFPLQLRLLRLCKRLDLPSQRRVAQLEEKRCSLSFPSVFTTQCTAVGHEIVSKIEFALGDKPQIQHCGDEPVVDILDSGILPGRTGQGLVPNGKGEL
ncbi:uncharacterized protein BKA78DRAFT_313406 [Phyllosticta capitalensis]|uniref:uncharacterized protein n=1 Tax=Phyllosticta capitalensis TaxID=121624 RepID=UPI003130A2CF